MSRASPVLLCAVLAAATAAAGPTRFDYRSFRNTTGLNLIGDAAVVDDRIRIVPSRRDTRGNVWTQQAYPVAGGFRTEFAFRYTHQGGSTDGSGHPGNDGLIFYIQSGSNSLRQDTDIPARSLSVFFD